MSEIPQNITRDHLLQAIERITKEGVPANAHSSTYDVIHEGKAYPPKLVISLANVFANGEELDRSSFAGGIGTDCFKLLEKEDFSVVTKGKESYWFVGASFNDGTDDQTDRFCNEGIWVNGYTDKLLDEVKRIKVGEKIAIKSTYTKKNNLPFEANGNTASVMGIKAIGVVTENAGDGRHLKVDWTQFPEKREWFFYTQRGTLWEVQRGDSLANALIDFTFNDKPQDYELFRNHGYWSERFGDRDDVFDYFPQIEKFLAQTKTDNLKTKDYLKEAYDLAVKVSFGQGTPARIPWISFLGDGQATSEGIYPSYLYFKDIDLLTLGYGSSEENTPSIQWPPLVASKHKDYLLERYEYTTPRYGNSRVFKAYDVGKGLDKDAINRDLFELVQTYKDVLSGTPTEVRENQSEYNKGSEIRMPLNSILYGPPGTGKTFNTINHALSIIDPKFLDKNADNRSALKVRFDELIVENRIHFVTFHQSFSYEDFVEGLRANSVDGAISYSVETGIFKNACIAADQDTSKKLDAFDSAITDLVDLCEQSGGRLKLTTVRGKSFSIEYTGGDTFKVFPESTKDEKPNYVASIPNAKKLYLTGSKKGIYNQSYVEGLLLFLKSELGLPEYQAVKATKSGGDPVVLIIDEINRGNISSIFGELITLIEPSKRAGAEEALSVTLPYSKETFQVPSNLYLIGTMNTADRSLALMDTALRRRFDFVEMMPDVDLLDGVEVKGINIKTMLTLMNKRIEVLYDREHTLGHAFFMPLKSELDEDKRFKLLQSIFSNKILPLLEEYFFEDWAKIRLVLGDDNKASKHQFISENGKDYDAETLFGKNVDLGYELEEQKSYTRNDEALVHPETYLGIYA